MDCLTGSQWPTAAVRDSGFTLRHLKFISVVVSPLRPRDGGEARLSADPAGHSNRLCSSRRAVRGMMRASRVVPADSPYHYSFGRYSRAFACSRLAGAVSPAADRLGADAGVGPPTVAGLPVVSVVWGRRRGAHCASTAATAARLTISATSSPRWSTWTGLSIPASIGPTASAPPSCWSSL